MKGRVYDPLAGRFLRPDPVTQAPFWSQGLNRLQLRLHVFKIWQTHNQCASASRI